MKKLIICLLVLISFSGCTQNTVTRDVIISRSDELNSRPKWLVEGNTFITEDGFVYILGQTKIPAQNANIAMGYRIAENNAKIALASTIQQRLDYIFQNAEEGLKVDQNQVKFVSAEASKLTASNIMLSNRYWEKVVSTIDAKGNKEVFYNIFARIRISEDSLKEAVESVLNKNKNKLSVDFKKQVDKHWDNFIEDGKNNTEIKTQQ